MLEELTGKAQRSWRKVLTSSINGYDEAVRARGFEYARAGRVQRLRVEEERVVAVVRGTEPYTVTLRPSAQGPLRTDCECPAFHQHQQCKHVAAVVLVLTGATTQASPSGTPAARPEVVPDVPELVRLCPDLTAGALVARLGLYAGRSLPRPASVWLSLRAYFRTEHQGRSADFTLVHHTLVRFEPEILRELEQLRSFEPPVHPEPGSPVGQLYDLVAKRYRARRSLAQIIDVLPGPFDARHPGIELRYDETRRYLLVAEKTSPLLVRPQTLGLTVPVQGKDFLEVQLPPSPKPYVPSVWELRALKLILEALVERTNPAIVALCKQLEMPAWAQLLDQLSVPDAAEQEATELSFELSPMDQDLWLALQQRPERNDGRKTIKWRRASFDEALDGTLVSSPQEKAIARAALALPPHRAGFVLSPGTPQGHEILRLLAQHPRVFLSGEPAKFLVGDLSMRLDQNPDGRVRPTFRIGEVELPRAVFANLRRETKGTWHSFQLGEQIGSVMVPKGLRGWVHAWATLNEDMAFPPEAIAKVTERVAPLLQEGVAEVPREVLGVELPYEPECALRVEWTRSGSAVVTLVASVHAAAPLINLGSGPKLFTFMFQGRRVFVERDPQVEIELATRFQHECPVPLSWEGASGRTDELEVALSLAKFLDENPMRMRCEVKLGAAPKLVPWADVNRSLSVSREGAWFRVDANFEDLGKGLTLGEILDAARLARRFVDAGDGTFLELSDEVRQRLLPLATAAELAPKAKGDEADGELVHDAFTQFIAQAQSLFSRVEGIDAVRYVRDLEASRGAPVHVTVEVGALRPYQREGAEWILALSRWAPGCMLADDMGLGKTVQTAAVLLARSAEGPALVVAPASVASNWMAELARFVPSLKLHWFNEDRRVDVQALGAKDVLVVSYGLLHKQAATFKARSFHTLVLDEAQYLKNALAQRTDVVRNLERKFCVALTGTPLENHLGELYSLMDIVFPGLLGSEPTFRERFRKPIESAGNKDKLPILGKLLAPFVLRRTRDQVLRELPERQDVDLYIDRTPLENKRYAALRKACEIEFTKRKKGETQAQTKIALLAALTRLRQLACDVSLVDPAFKDPSSKLVRMAQLCQELAEQKRHVLVFSQFTSLLGNAMKVLAPLGLRVAYLAGETPTTKRKALVDAFQDGQYDVFCISLKAGGTGLNLTRATYVIHLDPWWNPAVEEQANSRARRMGQEQPVTTYRLIARGTIEEAILKMHDEKRELALAVLEGKGTTKALGPGELLDLLRYGED